MRTQNILKYQPIFRAIMLLLMLLSTSSSFGADKTPQFIGEWEQLSFESNGKIHELEGRDTLLFDGQMFRRFLPDRFHDGKYVLTSNGKRNYIDFIYSKRAVVRGIYEIKGDILRLSTSFEMRPTEFSTSKGDGMFYEVYKRISSDKPILRNAKDMD